MDPLSIIASIAGISTAGISLSRAIYDAISSVRNAPKDVSRIAKGLCDLSFTLRELRQVLRDGKDIYRRKLIRRVASAIKRVGRVQREIEGLLDATGSLAKLRWAFRKSKTMELLYAIESHKTGINMILQTMMLAVQLKQLSRENERKIFANGRDENEDSLNDAVLARQQAENMVQISFHSLRELTSERSISSSQLGSDDEGGDSDHGEDSRSQQIQIRNPQTFDNAIWLCDLVFSAAIEATAESTKSEPDQESTLDNASIHRSWQDLEDPASDNSSTQALVLHSNSSLARLQALTQQPPAASTVINELLSEWTTLTEGEIEGIDRVKQQEKKPNHESASDAADDEVRMVNFKDAVGRKFELPFHLIQEWAGIEDLIKQMFLHVDIIGPHVQAGHYDVLNSRGSIVLPSLWKYSIKPTESYSMAMWVPPGQKPAREKPPGGPPPPPGGKPFGGPSPPAGHPFKGVDGAVRGFPSPLLGLRVVPPPPPPMGQPGQYKPRTNSPNVVEVKPAAEGSKGKKKRKDGKEEGAI
ncbi:hypothetical protein F5B21DRAFT_485137 [Xylaria acuta]|nr:hypothetical protein F5B21DRAFT_485137 [Xylaria acuta]